MFEFAFHMTIERTQRAGEACGEFVRVENCREIHTNGCFPMEFACHSATLTISPAGRVSLDDLPAFLGSLATLQLVYRQNNQERERIGVLDCARVDASQIIAPEQIERMLREQHREIPDRVTKRQYAMQSIYGFALENTGADRSAPCVGSAVLAMRGERIYYR